MPQRLFQRRADGERERARCKRERETHTHTHTHKILCFLRQRQRQRHRERGKSKDERYLKVLVEKQWLVALEVCAKPCGSGASLLFHSPFSKRKICECVFFPVELWASRVSMSTGGFFYPMRRGHRKLALGYRRVPAILSGWCPVCEVDNCVEDWCH